MRSHANPSPRVGIPYRTRNEELRGDFAKIEPYLRAVRQAGGEPVVMSLGLANEHLEKIARTLDAIVLPGSPADIDPERFGAARHPAAADADPYRERTDFGLLHQALADQVPVLTICYGVQSLNVFLSGRLVQDIPSELPSAIKHDAERHDGNPETFHPVDIETDSRLGRLAGAGEARVNSSHHQAILEPGRSLRVVARAPDGVVEAVEWTGDANWIMGVQWHPERMTGADALARALFEGLVEAARRAPVRT